MEDKQSLIDKVLQHIREAAERAGRTADEVTLVAVSKTRPLEDILAAYEVGVRHFGENRAEEFAQKAAALSHLTDLQWHFIGHLQTRQSKPVADHAHCFHALDRLKIAERLSRQLQEAGRTLPVFIEVNVSGEASKGGFNCADWENDQVQRDAFLQAVQQIVALPNLEVRGLMTMAPFDVGEDEIRSVFRRLHQLSEWLNTELPDLQARQLSMGMSGDFELAVEEGATHVRVGTAIFGVRNPV